MLLLSVDVILNILNGHRGLNREFATYILTSLFSTLIDDGEDPDIHRCYFERTRDMIDDIIVRDQPTARYLIDDVWLKLPYIDRMNFYTKDFQIGINDVRTLSSIVLNTPITPGFIALTKYRSYLTDEIENELNWIKVVHDTDCDNAIRLGLIRFEPVNDVRKREIVSDYLKISFNELPEVSLDILIQHADVDYWYDLFRKSLINKWFDRVLNQLDVDWLLEGPY